MVETTRSFLKSLAQQITERYGLLLSQAQLAELLGPSADGLRLGCIELGYHGPSRILEFGGDPRGERHGRVFVFTTTTTPLVVVGVVVVVVLSFKSVVGNAPGFAGSGAAVSGFAVSGKSGYGASAISRMK